MYWLCFYRVSVIRAEGCKLVFFTVIVNKLFKILCTRGVEMFKTNSTVVNLTLTRQRSLKRLLVWG